MVKRMLQVLVVIAAAAGMLTILFLAVKTRKLQVNRWVVKDSDIVGVDISEYQADVDMEKLAEQNVQFIYMKATEGSGFTDSRFADNWAAAAEHGIPAGAYHFFSFDSPGSMQAQNYIDTVGPLGDRSLIPAVDVEFYADKRNDPPEREELIRELGDFLDALEEEYHVKPMIYAPREICEKYLLGHFDEYPRWVRSIYYPVTFETGSSWVLWQYSDTGELEGYLGGEHYIDLDVLNRGITLDDITIGGSRGTQTMVYNNILEAIGNTPMIRLSRMPEEGSAEILVKMEGLNVGGSIKTRTALNMIEQAEKQGLIHPDTIIVEPTSGNQGIGLALVGAVKGYKTIIIMPDSVSEERRKLVRHYGAEVILIHDAGDIGACIDECLQTALRMRDENPKVFVPQQFENPNNTLTHKKYTALEIMAQVAGPIDGFCAGIGTGGTITGIGEVLKAQYPDIEIWAVEPENAAILAGGTVGTHLQMGIGDGIIPDILNQNIYNDIYVVTDEEALDTSRRLAREEGLMVGISAGTNVAAALKLAKKLGKGKTVVTVLPDTAERYFSTPLFME